ncbi:MAG: thiamine-binding protein [Actinobacteria bacterium]|nr:thiamine-binding protein [Actinomycetota bacterium]
MIVEIQCLPTPPGTDDEPYAHVERAIAEIQDSGLRYEVGALGTTVEGDPDVVWPLLRRVHETCVRSAALSVVTIIKVAQGSGAAHDPHIDDLVSTFR